MFDALPSLSLPNAARRRDVWPPRQIQCWAARDRGYGAGRIHLVDTRTPLTRRSTSGGMRPGRRTMIAARNGPARQGAGNYRALERNIESGDPDEQGRRARLMADAQRGDRDAYGALLNDLGPIVMRLVRRHVRDGNDTEDVYQDVFTALHRARHTYDPSRPFEPWLFAITRRV